MADIIIPILLFEIFFFVYEPDLNLGLRVAGSPSRGLPSFGTVSLPRIVPYFDARCFRLLQGGDVLFEADVELGMLQ